MAKKKKTFPETKAFQVFDGQLRTLKQHLQLVDISLALTNKMCLANKESGWTIAKALNTDEQTHPQLNMPCVQIDIQRTFASSRIKFNEQAIIDLYRYFSNYIANIIEEFVRTNPMPLLDSVANNKDNTLTFKEVLKAGSFDSIVTQMSQKIYRRFENERSTTNLLNKIISYSDIKINEAIKNESLIYLEIRHLIIHNNSKADTNFKGINNNLVAIKNGNKIALNYELTTKAINTVYTLCKEIDSKLIQKNMVCGRFIEYPEFAPQPI